MGKALERKKRLLAEQDKQQSQPTTADTLPLQAHQHDLKEQLTSDLAIIKQLDGDQQRLPMKEKLIEKYRKEVETKMREFHNWARQPMIFWWLMWRLDVEGFDSVATAFEKAVEHGLTTPENFERDWQTIYLDQVKLAYEELLKTEQDFDSNLLKKVVDQLTQGDLATNSYLKAKLFALRGKVAMAEKDLTDAKKYFEQALKYNEKSGVKTLLKRVNKELGEQDASE